MSDVIMYGRDTCPYCLRAKSLLERKQVTYHYIDVLQNPNARAEMQTKGAGHTVPQIFIGGNAIGGCDDLFALDVAGELDKLLMTK